MTKVKICGITNIKDALVSQKSGADFLGFIFYKKSKRYVTAVAAKRIIASLNSRIHKVGVFVDEDPSIVEKIASFCGLDYLQFHGEEEPEYVAQFKKYQTIKAIRVRDYVCLDEVKAYKGSTILFDTLKQGFYGGTGKVFDWEALRPVKKVKRPFIVSGGLTVENVAELVKSFKPFAVDVAGGVEKKPGKKDHALVKEFVKTVKYL
ncbi:MAG: phosphoribosylanthranilate isomerase [Candidatus Omnitrophota bacterium]